MVSVYLMKGVVQLVAMNSLALVLTICVFGYVAADGNPGKYLVTMEKKELIDVVDCVSKSKDPLLCTKFAACERLMSPRVLFALDECKKEVVPDGIKRCTPYSIIFESKEVPEKIFDCVVEKIEKLTFPEKKIMLNFEECTKLLFEESCGKKL